MIIACIAPPHQPFSRKSSPRHGFPRTTLPLYARQCKNSTRSALAPSSHMIPHHHHLLPLPILLTICRPPVRLRICRRDFASIISARRPEVRDRAVRRSLDYYFHARAPLISHDLSVTFCIHDELSFYYSIAFTFVIYVDGKLQPANVPPLMKMLPIEQRRL